MLQSQALNILKTGANVFLTGEPGAGKTHTINTYVRYLRERGIEPSITASTGIAATHIGGVTIHSWSGIGIRSWLSRYDLDKISSSEYVVKRIRRTQVLIIDEISMLSSETLEMIDAVCRAVRQTALSFGGLQVIFVGDFFQLPPIQKFSTENNAQGAVLQKSRAVFAYDSPAWTRAKPSVCYLTEQYRQDDAEFLNLLSAIRSNLFEDKHLQKIQTRKITKHQMPFDAPKLYSLNVDVDRVNDEMLAKIISKSEKYEMTSHGPAALVAIMQKGCLSPKKLVLKVGAAVMFTKNNPKEGFVNGTLGTVMAFDGLNNYPIVVTRAGKKITVEPADWKLEEDGKLRAKINQLPLRLAWAITVHKSQGMSLDEAVMDLGQVFEYGQGYVALSRVRRMNGVYLLGWNERTFQVHPDILAKDKFFSDSSAAIEMAFGKLSVDELQKMHHNFIKASRGVTVGGSAPFKKKVRRKRIKTR